MTQRDNNLFTIYINNFYNFLFKYFNNIKFDNKNSKENIKLKINNLEHSSDFQTVWLLNIKRLYNEFKKRIKPVDYHFIDIGCGNGIPLIYAYKNFEFKSYSGFDFIQEHIEISKDNIKLSLGKDSNIEVFKFDAKEYKLDNNKSFFVFMYNPFSGYILDNFLKNNFELLKANKSVIAYSNLAKDQLEVMKKYNPDFILNKKYKTSVIFF